MRQLTEFWLDQATRIARKKVPGFDAMTVVESWKMDGWNDGTTTLFLVCKDHDGTHKRIKIEDYQPVVVETVIAKETVTISWVAT